MIYLKKFESYKEDISRVSDFTKDDVKELYDIFQDFAIEYSIRESEMEINLDKEDEHNQYYVGVAKNAYIEMYLFRNVDEIIETLNNNFLPQVESIGWRAFKSPIKYSESYNSNLIKYYEVSIVFIKQN